jgi:molybdate transport system ATP-binding protein
VAELLDRPARALSGGERRRVALGRALLVRPRVLLLDEPFAGLEAPLRARLLAYVARLGVPHVVLVTHDARDALGLADEVVALDRGRVAARGAPERVFGPDSELVEPSALLRGVVRATFEPYAEVDVGGAALQAHLPGARPGEEVRLALRADEVTLALARHGDLSARNQVEATVTRLETRKEQLLAVLDGGLLALLDPRSAAALGLVAGCRVVAQFKAAALRRAGV